MRTPMCSYVDQVAKQKTLWNETISPERSKRGEELEGHLSFDRPSIKPFNNARKGRPSLFPVWLFSWNDLKSTKIASALIIHGWTSLNSF